jgi:hypothetical protein
MNWTNRVWDCHVILSCYLGELDYWMGWMWFQRSVDVGWMKNSQDPFVFCVCKVNRPVTEHFSAQGRPDSRVRLHCFWCPNQTWTPPLGASHTLIIVENGLEMKKLQPPKVWRSRTQKQTNHWTLQRPIFEHPKNSWYVALLLLKLKDDL